MAYVLDVIYIASLGLVGQELGGGGEEPGDGAGVRMVGGSIIHLSWVFGLAVFS